jgi:peptidoglycan/xylan/chitin deacetylase (PgdA/CDA1 family)/tetratricopeptide (TPR) repeat protein
MITRSQVFMTSKRLAILGAAVVAAGAILWFILQRRDDPALAASLDAVTNDYRRIIVLMDGSEALDDATRARSVAAGRMIFYRKQQEVDELARKLEGNSRGLRQFVGYLSGNPALHDGDKLAFLDLVETLDTPAARSHPLKALRDNLQVIQLAYREEVTRIFAQFATRGASATREKWEAYTAALRQKLSREKIFAEFGEVLPEEPSSALRGGPAKSNEVFGDDFAPKTIALTFDDGPHPRYTEQVLALLRKYGIRATFFELGTNLGTVSDTGEATLSRTGEIAKKVLEAGHTIANHSFSHPVLPKLTEAQRTSEIDRTTLLLTKVAGQKPVLFRAPYGARNSEILQTVTADGMRSVMWNIDSLDWADPIPESIAMRVLHELTKRQKGIILFHDIHKQSVLALSPVIEELMRQDYTFLAFDKGQFVKTAPPEATDRSAPAPNVTSTPTGGRPSLYRESFALIVGINDYQNWPKLRYAVNDANSVEDALVNKFGFKRENVRKLIDRDATRQRILEILGDDFTDGKKIQRDDRVFVFFAGHGATRTFDDGRQLGFIVPVDADPANYYSTAISMTSLREAADLISAKHIYFVMDSCYSGLALTRGGGAFSKDRSYLEEISRRSSRQILTAGGADQQVADDGPGGHSVFTWALLEGLQGKADLDGNGVITASELGAYISPIVSSFAKQTPTVGNLMGSEGGEFIFELQPQPLTATSPQMDTHALQLNRQLEALQKQIAAKQEELLTLQQSIQSESTKLALVKRSEAQPPVQPKPKALRAYDLDRQGQQLYREKKYDEALAKLQAAVALKPGDPVLLNNLGFLYYATGRYDDALSYLQKTLAVDPKRKEAHENIADTLMKLGRRDEAKQHYQQFLALHPTSSRADEIKKVLQ